jgi:sensor histidine kinase regulating citrate/malate metabolism
VEKALSRYELEGRESTIEYYNARTSVDGQWYVFIIDENDVIIAHPTIPENIGQDLNRAFAKSVMFERCRRLHT